MENHEQATVEELLRLAREGDPQKREELFNVCRSYLHAQAHRQLETWLKSKLDESDVVQQTLLEAVRDFDRFEGKSQAEWYAWLKSILQRNATDFIRHYRNTAKRDVRREVPLRNQADSRSDGALDPASKEPTPVQFAIRGDMMDKVQAALQRLSADHRQVIELRIWQRLKFEEIGRRMGRTSPAAQMLWQRAFQKLLDLLKEERQEE